jgi:hypothetical protein
MSHRAEQVIDAVVALLQASTTLGVPSQSVYPLRTFSLAEDQGEIPAVCVNFGDDNPADDYQTLDDVASALEVFTTSYLLADEEPELKRSLLDVRKEIHKAIVADSTLGLSFVLSIAYGGAAAPERDATGERLAGSQVSRWIVTYSMNPNDPS